MALILNIETATTVCSVSLAKDGKLLSLKEQNGDYSHAENLTVFIEDVCKQANINLSQIDAIAVSKGPGSYTGLRIGVSTAKGLCYSLDKPLIAVDTLKYLSIAVSSRDVTLSATKGRSSRAESRDEGHTVAVRQAFLFCPMLDARRMEVYCAIYNSEGNVVKETAAEIIDEHSFSDILATNKIVFFGDGSAKCKETFSKNSNAVFIDDIVPSAKDMITLSEKAHNEKQFEDVAYFEPYYLKDFVAGKKKGE
ncbi:MAG TPA: tRNA (adenosine(37)-N6)-threonylcarbamoyltransferase complex dimerization subunit type 1 TsaB [Bacteroidia bacterium]|nr:tRNA (adenosine(37)-N6)-threonylcarbamoyltransferase complex dimerization subunit type 1 TsaB [Bacteroidia bacterium]